MMTDFTPNFDNITAGSPTESARKSIVEMIRQYADHAGISHAEIARRTGMKQPSVNRVLNHRFCPKLDTIITIAHAVGLGIAIINPKIEWAVDVPDLDNLPDPFKDDEKEKKILECPNCGHQW